MIIRDAKRSNTSWCRICGHPFKKGEKYFKLDGSHRVMRSLMCIDHFKTKTCDNCEDRIKCLTVSKMTMCIVGENKSTKVEEI